MTTATDPKVWVRTGSSFQPYRLVDPTPLSADELGHVWFFDGGGSDPDDPRTCALCHEAAWKVYDKPCAEAAQLSEFNAERAKQIEERRYPGTPAGANGMGYTAWGGVAA